MRERASLPPSGAVVALAAGVAGVAGSNGAARFTPGYVVAAVGAGAPAPVESPHINKWD